MKDYLYDYYDESRVKSERRKKILNEITPHIITTGINSLTIKDISGNINIERRTLYDYYPTKEDLVVDCAYVCINELSEQYMKIAETLNLANGNLDSKKRLRIIMKGIAKVINEKYDDLFNFITGFDVYYHHLDKDSNAYYRYEQLIKGFKTRNHYLKEILNDVVKEYNVEFDVNELVEIVEQSFHSYLSRILVKQDSSNRYDIDRIDHFIDIIVEGVCFDPK